MHCKSYTFLTSSILWQRCILILIWSRGSKNQTPLMLLDLSYTHGDPMPYTHGVVFQFYGYMWSANSYFFVLQKPPISKVKTEGIYITSEHPFLTYDHLKTVEIKKCRRCYEARVNEILKLFSDCGIPSSKIRIHYKKSQGQPSKQRKFHSV
jgi:ribosomal protein L37E